MAQVLPIYQRLSQVYDLDWGRFSSRCVDLIETLLRERGLVRVRVLDLACGTGVLAVALAEKGHVVRGIDISPAMVEIARQRATTPRVCFQVQDMARLRTSGPFDLVTCTYDSVNYLRSDRTLRRLFHRVAEVLTGRGLFVFDAATEQLARSAPQGTGRRELGGISFLHRFEYDVFHRELRTVFEFRDGTREVHRQYPRSPDGVQDLLLSAGLAVTRLFSGYDGADYRPDAERVVYVAEKKRVYASLEDRSARPQETGRQKHP
ncbi:MAG: class I SAM-dependent DNA methyltransferase [Chloroflexota bacterium]